MIAAEQALSPWQSNGKTFDEWHIRTAWIHGQLKDKAGIIGRSLHFSDDEKDRHGVWLSKEDADLIIAAVNAMPAFLDIAEVAAALPSPNPKADPAAVVGGSGPASCWTEGQ